MPDALRIIFTGAGEFGVPTLEALISTGHEVVQVVSQPDRPAGRGRVLTPTAISQLALARDLPLLRTDNINRQSLPQADIMVVIAFGQKIAPNIVQHPRLGSVNLHSSLLPKYRGAAPINAAIINGETVTGNSVIRLAEKMDAGAILGQSEIMIGDTETAGELHDRLATGGAALVLQVVQALARGTASERPQDHAAATLAPKLTRESTRLDWTHDADVLSRQIRGMYPWPGCRARIMAGDEALATVTLARTQALGRAADRLPGTIDVSGQVATGRGSVAVLEIQPQGKRPMTLEAFRNGNPWHAGLRLESIV